ncbi:DUF1513 domain-containing protein [Thalassovita taeanensis]|uniref:Twin-arginine translocation pathway signal n=1 Tax=Thalassovita taeanensis TaxID=657014 RepID=A0A1H9JX13_9RHOB|nr:DUF1513 domain-containing protein [Thalassovita taeanensis]SEQ91347.1 hypothetical protein SAMN04488092_11670 [Thalassovita taeanensis]
MATRRGFIAGLIAAGLVPKRSWADAGSPSYLAAARQPDGLFSLIGLDSYGAEAFRVPLPGRGHAAAAHPTRPEAVAFARRPGTFALVIDCATGQLKARLDSAEGHHFYGHGAFSRDGSLLFTSENAYETATGMIGIWDVTAGYRRIGAFKSHGIGPHDIRLMPGAETLAVANGGIETHPDSGRAKLNLPTMRPNLSFLSFTGEVLDQVEPDPALHLNSIRHLALRGDGTVGFAMQWQGDTSMAPPLLGLRRPDGTVQYLQAPDAPHRAMERYAGSVSFCADGTLLGITSPRGGQVQVFQAETGDYAGSYWADDVCGLSDGPAGFMTTSGTGDVDAVAITTREWRVRHTDGFDNHLVRITPTL